MAQLFVDDVAIHYECFGAGEPIVFVHGLGTSMAFWYFGIASVLAQHYRVILYDLRGHGKSAMPLTGYTMAHMLRDLRSLLDHLGVQKMHLVAHSMGARIALQYATTYPEQLETLTIADAGCLQPRTRLRDWKYWQSIKQELNQQQVPLPEDDEFITFRMLLWLNQFATTGTPQGIGAKLGCAVPGKLNKKRKLINKWQTLLQTTTARTEFCEDDQVDPDAIKSIAVPTLAIYGEYSHCLPSCRRLQCLIQTCHAVVIRGVGHFHPIVKPRLISQILHEFLRQYQQVHVPLSLQAAISSEIWFEERQTETVGIEVL